ASFPRKSNTHSFFPPPTRVKTTKIAAPINVACVFSIGGITDSGFNEMAYAGLQKAESEGLCTFTYVEPTDTSQFQGYLDSYAASGSYDLIIAVGFAQDTAVNETAKSYPTQAIAIIDTPVNQGNVSSFIFKEHEGSFLVGAMAGLMTQTGRVGFIGGMDIALIRKFWAGFKAGVLYEKNNSYIEVFEDFVGSWGDPATGKAIAETMWAQGVDIIFTAAGTSGNGVLESANEQGEGFYAIGVDEDQDYLYPGSVLCSMMKRVDMAVYSAIKDVYDSTWTADVKNLGLVEDGVGISPLNYTKEVIGSDNIYEVNVTVRNKIIEGDFSVPTNTTELTQWITDMGIVSKKYTPHHPIYITSSVQFTTMGFSGTGIPSNPYRIEGLYINATSGNLIEISGITDHFVIGANLLNGRSSAGTGIQFYTVSNGTIANNTIYNCNGGIALWNSYNNSIVNNSMFVNSYNALNLELSGDNIITNNIIHDVQNESGISINESSNNNVLSYNQVFNNFHDGIRVLTSSNYNTITKNTCYNNNWAGIRLQSANHNNTITNNTVFGNEFNGILIEGPTPSDNNTVAHNTVYNNLNNGIALWQGSGMNRILNNTIYGNTLDGINIVESTNNRLIHNFIFDNDRYGILLVESPDHSIEDNSLTNNGIFWAGSTYGSYIQASVENNWINGKPFVYWNGVNGGTIPNGAGQIFLFDCIGVTISHQNLHSTSVGISAAFSSYLTIQHNTAYNNRWGILIDRRTNETTLINNTLNNNFGDIQLWAASNNIVTDNRLSQNSNYGIFLDMANENLIANNTFSETKVSGIRVLSGTGNSIEHNIFDNNTGYAIIFEDASSSNSVRFNDFTESNLGGVQALDNGTDNDIVYNYWSDWTSPDIDDDGFVDHPYMIDGTAGNEDYHPLTSPNPSDSCLLFFLRVLYPNGDEIVSGIINIRWSWPEDSYGHELSFDVYYSDGGDWILLGTGLTDASYSWNTNSVSDGSSYRIRVVTTCAAGHITEDTSDDTFTINNAVPTTSLPPETTPGVPTTTTTIEFSTSIPPVVIRSPGMTGVVAILSLLPLQIVKKRKTTKKSE
ncbi:MAG: BMP family ABC transporter substrate-binding protein, partial [Promethearchaeota archaeon]